MSTSRAGLAGTSRQTVPSCAQPGLLRGPRLGSEGRRQAQGLSCEAWKSELRPFNHFLAGRREDDPPPAMTQSAHGFGWPGIWPTRGTDSVLGWPQAELWAELVWLWPLATDAGRKWAEGLAYTYIASIT